MSWAQPNRFARVTALTLVAIVFLWVADRVGGGLSLKLRGWLLAAASAVFLISDAFFWKAIDRLSELPTSDSLTAKKAAKMAVSVRNVKAALIQRWGILLALKVVAGTSGVWLINQADGAEPHRIVWLAGVFCIVVSFPLAMSFLRVWQAADGAKQQQVIQARSQKETASVLAELSKPPATPLKADEMLAGYSDVVGKAKRKSTSQH